MLKLFGTLSVLFALLWGLSAPAVADEPSPEDTQTETEEQPGRYELVCTTERQTGSRIARRVCRTQAQIDQEHEDARELISRTRDRSAQTSRPTN